MGPKKKPLKSKNDTKGKKEENKNKAKSNKSRRSKNSSKVGKSDGIKSRRKTVPRLEKPPSGPPLPDIIADTIVDYLHETEGDSPINLEWESFIKIRTSPIEWTNHDVQPLSLTLRNTAYNVVLTGRWPEGKIPSVTKGPLPTKYDFAQIHFHWGPDNNTGSDHTVEGASLPFEIHSVFYKASSGSFEEAKKDENGIVMFCYMFKIHESFNDNIKLITDNVEKVKFAYNTYELEPVPLNSILDIITDDYIVYLGYMEYKAVHGVTFIISRETNTLDETQLSGFRGLKDRHENPMFLKERPVHDFGSRNVFVVNPKSKIIVNVLHPRKSKYRRSSSP